MIPLKYVHRLNAFTVFMYVEKLPEPPKPKQGFFKSYELGMPLGQGGSGKVYQAKSQNGRLHAVKIVTPDVVERRPPA